MQRRHDINEILEKGLEVIREKGYTNTGIDDILKANGIPKGSFYNFFKSKEEFGVQAMRRYTERQIEWIEGFLGDKTKKPFARLKDFYESLIAANVDENCRKGCLVGNMTQEMAGLSDPIGHQAQRSLQEISNIIAGCIQEGQDLEEIRVDYSAKDLADYLHNSFYGFLLRAKAGRDKRQFDIFIEMMFKFIKK
jgi:TetR/AcrR family transcriptional repressor of nem operon